MNVGVYQKMHMTSRDIIDVAMVIVCAIVLIASIGAIQDPVVRKTLFRRNLWLLFLWVILFIAKMFLH